MNPQTEMILDLREWCSHTENRLWIHKEVLYQMLAGVTRPSKILERLDAAPTKENREYLSNEIMTGELQTQLELAKRDMIASVTDRFRERAHRYANKMEHLSESAKEERTQYMAAKDLLDRAGTGAVQKITVSTPSQYKRVVEEFLLAEKESQKKDG